MLSTVEATKSLIKAAEFEAQRLRGMLYELQAMNQSSLQFLATARKTDHKPDIKVQPISNPEIWRERADMACALAEEAHDPAIKRLLLAIAKSYDDLAK